MPLHKSVGANSHPSQQLEKRTQEEVEEEETPKARKRARANTAGEATSPILNNSQGDDEEEDESVDRTLTRAGVKTLDRDPADGFVLPFHRIPIHSETNDAL